MRDLPGCKAIKLPKSQTEQPNERSAAKCHANCRIPGESRLHFGYAHLPIVPNPQRFGIMDRLGAPISMCKNDSYLVRVTSLADSADSFTWEVCKGDPLLVLQRSSRTFPTRVEALFDSASKAFLLAFGPEQS